MGTIINFNPTQVHDYSKYEVGGIYTRGNGEKFKYVEFAEDVTPGIVVEFVAGSAYTQVTGAGGSGTVAGIVTSSNVAVATGFKFGWVQFQGPNIASVAAATATEGAGAVYTNGAGAGTIVAGTADAYLGAADAAAVGSLYGLGDVLLQIPG